MYRGKGSSRQLVGVLFKEPLSSEACLGRVEAAAFHHTYLRAGNMKNGGGQGITESQHLMHALKRLDTKEGYFGKGARRQGRPSRVADASLRPRVVWITVSRPRKRRVWSFVPGAGASPAGIDAVGTTCTLMTS